jgi:putative sterol carrier protein
MPDSVSELMQEIANRFSPDAWGGDDAVLAFDLTGEGGGQWVARIAGGKLSVEEGPAADADMTMTCSASDLLAMAHGELNAVSAFMQGRVKIQGNMSLAMKLQSLIG